MRTTPAPAVGVSRTPVREALLRLEAQGMLRLHPERGALVLAVTAQEADDLFEARSVVEGFAAQRAWAGRAFHVAVVEAAGNAVFTRLYDSLRDRQTCMGVADVHSSPERMDQVVEQHAELLEALRGEDPGRFAQLVRRHVDAAAESLRRGR